METRMLEIGLIEPNDGQVPGLPANPRDISAKALRRLKKSIKDDPEMLELREIVVYPHGGRYVAICGNQRFRACLEMGFGQVPCKILPEGTSDRKLRAYASKDNVPAGEFNWEMIEEEWDAAEMTEWGVQEDWGDDEDYEDEEEGGGTASVAVKPGPSDSVDKDSSPSTVTEFSDGAPSFSDMILDDRIFNYDNDFEIPVLLKSMQALPGLVVPFAPWGADSRLRTDVQTYHFYVDDYRFEAIWKDPSKLVNSGCKVIVEPNLSLYETTPIAYGLHMIYKKRWISRWLQEKGIRVYADLNVASKFYGYNQLGIPEGYNAFCTRGYSDRLEYTKMEVDIARRISGCDTPNMLIYGGGKAVKEFCCKNGLIYTESFINGERKEALKGK